MTEASSLIVTSSNWCQLNQYACKKPSRLRASHVFHNAAVHWLWLSLVKQMTRTGVCWVGAVVY